MMSLADTQSTGQVSEKNSPRSSKPELFGKPELFFLFFGTLFLNLFAAHFNILDLDHEAVLFKPALDLVEGKMLFKESFMQYGPMSALLEALVIRLAGPSVLYVREFLCVLNACIALFLWQAWFLVFRSRRIATAAALIWNLLSLIWVHVFIVWASGFALFFQSLCLLLVLQAIPYLRFEGLSKKRNLLRFGVAGASAACCLLCKQNVGVFLTTSLLVGFVVLLWLRKLDKKKWSQSAFCFCLGFFGTLASLVFWIVRRGALQDWWLQNFVWPSAWARYFGQEFKMSFLLDKLVPWTNINAVPIDWPFYVVSPLCCVILFSGCLHIALANRGKSLGFVSKFILSSNVDGLVILCCVSLASWLQYYPIPGIGHLWWSITPGIGALVWASSAVIGKFAQTISDQFFHKTRFQIRPHWVWAVVIALLAGGPICRRVADAYDLLFLPVAAVQGHNAFTGLRIHPFKARYLENVESLVNDVVNSSPEPHYVYVDGPEAMYTTFVRNARGFHPVWITVYPQMIEAIYPEYPKQLNEFVRDKEPIILFTGVLDAETFKKYPGYAVAGAVKGRDSDENSPIKGVNLATMKDLFILRKSKPR